jgi:proline iminopeptidase
VRQWLGVDQVIVAGGSYGGFIAMEYAIAYPEHTRAMILRDTSPDSTNLKLVFENARKQTRVDLDWDNFERYWTGHIRDDADLKACWAEIAPLYSYEDDRERAAARVENGSYRHETHNWCFQQNRATYDVKPALPGVRCPTLITVGRHDWVTPVAMSKTIAALIPDSQLVIFEKSGHSPPSDEPELFRRVVRDFLAEVAPEASAASR